MSKLLSVIMLELHILYYSSSLPQHLSLAVLQAAKAEAML